MASASHRLDPVSFTHTHGTPIAVAVLALLFALGNASSVRADEEPDGRALLEERCAACHRPLNAGSYSRIGEMRKTPEGWDRSIQRMQLWHGVEVSRAERAALVKLLADTRGLAPSEAQPYRYGMEQEPGAVEREEDQELAVLCARCHSFAHLALQRRTREEWLRLAHTHAGQWPTLEFQDKARDRRWWELATTKAPDTLAARFPLESAAWTAWQRQSRWSPVGEWRVRGTQPGGSDFAGAMRIRGDGRDHYQSEFDLLDAAGDPLVGKGEAIVYTGYEWRGSAEWNSQAVRQVWALSEGGDRLGGRWYLEGQDSIGGELEAVRVSTGEAQIRAVLPKTLRAGQRQSLVIHGAGLPPDGKVSLGAGVIVAEVLSRNENRIHLVAQATEDLVPGVRTARVGAVSAPRALTVYREVDALRVEPSLLIARLGGGKTPAVPAQFEAIGILRGADGRIGTEDDLEIRSIGASWRLEAYDEISSAMKDVDFAGTIDARGRFEPAEAGPNPKRPFSTNNAGRIRVVAALPGEGNAEGPKASAELVVTVQRWVDPIIR